MAHALFSLVTSSAFAAELDPVTVQTVDHIQGLPREIQKSLGPPSAICEPTQGDVANSSGSTASDLTFGARKVLGIFFQDCQALQKKIEDKTVVFDNVSRDRSGRRELDDLDRGQYITSHYALRGLRQRQSSSDPAQVYPQRGCRSVLGAPPIYAYGAKPLANSKEMRLLADISALRNRAFRNGVTARSSAVTGLDCSGLVGASFAAAGLRFTADSDNYLTSTHEIAELTHKSSSCISPARLDPSGVQPGDIINFFGHHVVIVDHAGPDPLGITKVKNCDEITPAVFDFTYIHSGSIGSFGPSRVDAKFHSRRDRETTLMNNVVKHAIKLCKKSRTSNDSSEPLLANNPRGFGILRHLGDKKRGCVVAQSKRIKLEGEDCLNGCKLDF